MTPSTVRNVSIAAGEGPAASRIFSVSRAERAAEGRRRIDPNEAGAHERDAVAQPVRLVEIVGGQHDRPAGPPQVSIASRTMNAASGSSAAVGSSRNTTDGSCSSARAMASFCFMPLLNVPVTSSRRSHRPNSADSARCPRRAARRRGRRGGRRSRGSSKPTACRTGPASRSGCRPVPGRRRVA